jgi:hypothetical protein
LFRYRQGVIDLDAEIPHRAFDLGMPEQELDSPQVACPPIDQGSFCSGKRAVAIDPKRASTDRRLGLATACFRNLLHRQKDEIPALSSEML